MTGGRRGYQREVARLLEQIGLQAQRRRLLEAAGARAPALAGLARKEAESRRQLAALTALH